MLRVMKFYITIILLSLSYRRIVTAVCVYLLSHKNSDFISNFLFNENIKITIHGEFTFGRNIPMKHDCDNINPGMIIPSYLWYSVEIPTNRQGCCKLQRHECEVHAKRNEGSQHFVSRVLTSCVSMTGKVRRIKCNRDPNSKFNVIIEIILYSTGSSKNINYENCDLSKPFITSWGSRILQIDAKSLVAVDVLRQSLENKEPLE
ncbi:hypothetical protein HZS_2507 [Henneguya salminicola]|nr:hypothetical protein HZS_2507 [Henneguya salminicola]